VDTLRNRHRDQKIPVCHNPAGDYRLFKKADLEELLRQIEQSGMSPPGWRRSAVVPNEGDRDSPARTATLSDQ